MTLDEVIEKKKTGHVTNFAILRRKNCKWLKNSNHMKYYISLMLCRVCVENYEVGCYFVEPPIRT